MASTITSSTLIVSVNEQINLNGNSIDSVNTLTISSINEVDKRIVTVPFSTEVTVLNFGTAVAAGTYIIGNVKYIRITNKDDTNFIRIRVTKATAQTFDIKLDAGKTFMMANTSESVSETAAAFSAFVDMSSINAQADTANVDCEVFIAST